MDAGKNVALDTEPKNGAYTSGYGAQPQSSSYPQPVGGSTYPPSGYPPPQNHASYPPPQQNGAYPAHHQQQQQQQPLYTAQPPPPPAPYSPYTAPPGSGGYPAQQYAATYSPNAPPVMMGGAATVLDTPPNVIVGDASDSCLIQHRNSLLMVIACIAAIGAVIAVINLIVKFNVLTLVGGIIALGLALGCAFFCHDVVIEFNKGSNAFRLMHRRLLFTLCDQRDIKIDVPFSQLGEPYAESSGPTGNGAALATIWLPIQAHPNVKLSAHQYHNEVDLQRDLMAWRVYINRFRGPASVGAALINAVHGAAAGLTSAIRI